LRMPSEALPMVVVSSPVSCRGYVKPRTSAQQMAVADGMTQEDGQPVLWFDDAKQELVLKLQRCAI
jgi:hypothetical protein